MMLFGGHQRRQLLAMQHALKVREELEARAAVKPYQFPDWAQDGEGWDRETGAPELSMFARAVQVWALFQNRKGVTVSDAASAFNCNPTRIVEAVESHPFMLLMGAQGDFKHLVIEHDGE